MPTSSLTGTARVRTVAGREAELQPPLTYASLLAVCAAALGLARERVKVRAGTTWKSLFELVKEAEANGVSGDLGDDVLLPAVDSSRSGRQRSRSQCGGAVILVSGVPAAAAQSAEQRHELSTKTSSGATVAVAQPTSTAGAQLKERRSARRRSRTASEIPGAAGLLPYPHCPVGLLELDEMCQGRCKTRQGVRELNALEMEFAICNHPTMQRIIHSVRGDLRVLRAVLSQVYTTSPRLFRWMNRNTLIFLQMLNGDGLSARQLESRLVLAHFLELSSLSPSRGQDPADAMSVVVRLRSDHDDSTALVWEVDYDAMEGVLVVGAAEAETPISTDEERSLGDAPRESDEYGDSLRTETSARTARSGHVVPRMSAGVVAPASRAVVASPTVLTPHPPAQSRSQQPVDAAAAAAADASAGEERRMPRVRRDSNPRTPISSSNIGRRRSQEGRPGGSSLSGNSATSLTPLLQTPQPPRASSPTGSPTAVLRRRSSSAPVPADLVLAALNDRAERAAQLAEAWRSTGDAEDALRAHAELQSVSQSFLDELAGNLQRVDNEGDFAWLVSATTLFFFPRCEEFYQQMSERGVRHDVFGTELASTLPALAFKAALARQLVCEAFRLVQQCVCVASATELTSTGTTQVLAESAASPMSPRRLRIGALRNFPPDCSPLMNPAVRWMNASGPDALLRELLLTLQTEQGSCLLWYSAHYYTKSKGKTLQSIAYVLNGSQGRRVSAVRLPLNSRVHREDKVLDCLRRIRQNCIDNQRIVTNHPVYAEWWRLMHANYKALVKPVEELLPPRYSSNILYVVDSRHEPTPANRGAEHASRDERAGALSPLGQARWFPGYADTKDNTLNGDRWCVAVSMSPWRIQLAHEVQEVPSPSSSSAVVQSPRSDMSMQILFLLDRTAPDTSPASDSDSTETHASVEKWRAAPHWLPDSVKARYDVMLATLNGSGIPPQHIPVVHEAVRTRNVTAGGPLQQLPLQRRSMSVNGLTPALAADLHVIDDCDADSGECNPRAVDGAGYRALLVHSIDMEVDAASYFYPVFYQKMASSPGATISQVARMAMCELMRVSKAPWLAVEMVVMDHGGSLPSMIPSRPAPKPVKLPTRAGSGTPPLPKFTPCASGASPPPLVTAAAAPPTGRTRSSSAEKVQQQAYSGAHGLDRMYEMMLADLLEKRPTAGLDVLDQLIHFVEENGDALRAQRRSSASPKGSPDGSANPSLQPSSSSTQSQSQPSTPQEPAATGSLEKPITPHPPSSTPPGSSLAEDRSPVGDRSVRRKKSS